MTKISKIITAASVLGVMGLAVLPAASYAAVNQADVVLSVTVAGTDSIEGGNNATGYVWLISDKDGGTTNLAKGVADDAGASTGGLSLIGTKTAIGTGVTANNSYGFQVNFTNLTGTVNGGQVFTDGSGAFYYGSDLLVSGAASAVTNASTPVAVSTANSGTVNVTVPSLTGSAAGGANSAYKYDATITPGTYKNTFVITCASNN
ncbi:hypothetical protein LJC64_04715 [Ruminococcaceae bacterium OttesenSCG-928-A11]|nr:hypothetical protein [Ruminococcaceae bacterium OttesenSCG-928-A11]